MVRALAPHLLLSSHAVCCCKPPWYDLVTLGFFIQGLTLEASLGTLMLSFRRAGTSWLLSIHSSEVMPTWTPSDGNLGCLERSARTLCSLIVCKISTGIVTRLAALSLQETTVRIRNAIRARYALLPYMYTLFRHANISGQPIMRPLWFDFPEVPATYSVEDEFMLGPALLVSHDPLWQELLAAKYLSGYCVGYHACQHASVYSTYGAMRLACPTCNAGVTCLGAGRNNANSLPARPRALV